jgi:hypothetical protein
MGDGNGIAAKEHKEGKKPERSLIEVRSTEKTIVRRLPD